MVIQAPTSGQVESPENPRGFMDVRVDANGRIKLPARFLEYLEQLTSKRMYITMLNGMARIYMNGSWERTLDGFANEPKKRKALTLAAARYGEDVTLDKAGKITLPQDLRKELKIEGEQIHLLFDKDKVTVYTEAQYKAATSGADEYLSGFIAEADASGSI